MGVCTDPADVALAHRILNDKAGEEVKKTVKKMKREETKTVKTRAKAVKKTPKTVSKTVTKKKLNKQR